MKKGKNEKKRQKIVWITGAALMFLGAVGTDVAGNTAVVPKEYMQYCEEAGQIYNICPELLEAVLEAESGGNPNALGKAGEMGLMQIYPKYHRGRAEKIGVGNLFEPRGNILTAADYLAELFARYGDVGTVLMVYNGTKNAVELGQQGIYTDYAEEVMQRAEELERLHGK